MRCLVAVLSFALLLLGPPASTPASAQDTGSVANFAHLYDLDSTNPIYCVMTGQGGSPFGRGVAGTINATTSGSSTTVTSVSGTPFASLAIGDTIIGELADGSTDTVVVVAKASGASITVSSAVDWEVGGAGVSWVWFDQTCGTAATNGWIGVRGASKLRFSVKYLQGDLDSLDVRWECRDDTIGALPTQIYPSSTTDECGDVAGGAYASGYCQYSTAAATAIFDLVDDVPTFAECRVALKVTTTDTSDAGANLEQVTASIVVYR